MAQLSHLLLFDPDPNGLESLTHGFERDGCSITSTAKAAEISDLIQGANSSLFIVSLRGAEEIGLELLRSTASNPRTRNLPCVAIGRDEVRSTALAAGAFAYLSTPLFVRDVIGACRLVAAASIPGSRPSPDAELSLRLGEVDGIYFLVRALAVAGRSTVVKLRHGQNRGELRFIDGTLTSADLGSVRGLPALHQMLLWEDAVLHFKFKNVVRRGSQLSLKSREVLEECDRFLRDFAHEAKGLGFARTRYTTALDWERPPAALPGEVVPVLKLFDGDRDLAQVLDDSPFRIFDTLKIVKRFVAEGAIHTKTVLGARGGEVDPGLRGPGALNVWLQKQTPLLGAELADMIPGRKGSQGPQMPSLPASGVGGAGGASGRPASPFVAVVDSETGTDRVFPVAAVHPLAYLKNGAGNPPAPAGEQAIRSNEVRPSDKPTAKPAPAVARGEIRTVAAAMRKLPTVPPSTAQTVHVEPSALPVAVPLVSSARPPVTALAASPSVIIAPMTPPPVAVESAAAVAEAPPEIEPRRQARSPSDSFSLVEADFFEREADLYKRESVESFDDLDRSGPNGRPPKR